jgi:ankyrin repeat protein
MIARKCYVNGISYESGLNPLVVAIQRGNRAMVSLLLDARATVPPLSSPLSPLRLAIASRSADVAELLISRGISAATIHDVVEAAFYGHHALLKLLISKIPHHSGSSVLHLLPLVTHNQIGTLCTNPPSSSSSRNVLRLSMRRTMRTGPRCTALSHPETFF